MNNLLILMQIFPGPFLSMLKNGNKIKIKKTYLLGRKRRKNHIKIERLQQNNTQLLLPDSNKHSFVLKTELLSRLK